MARRPPIRKRSIRGACPADAAAGDRPVRCAAARTPVRSRLTGSFETPCWCREASFPPPCSTSCHTRRVAAPASARPVPRHRPAATTPPRETSREGIRQGLRGLDPAALRAVPRAADLRALRRRPGAPGRAPRRRRACSRSPPAPASSRASSRAACRQATAIVATDLNQPMLDHAASVGTARPVEWRQADAHAAAVRGRELRRRRLPVRRDVLSRQGAGAFAEARRVLRPGGVLLFNVWDRIEDNEIRRRRDARARAAVSRRPAALHGAHAARLPRPRGDRARPGAAGGFAAAPRVRDGDGAQPRRVAARSPPSPTARERRCATRSRRATPRAWTRPPTSRSRRSRAASARARSTARSRRTSSPSSADRPAFTLRKRPGRRAWIHRDFGSASRSRPSSSKSSATRSSRAWCRKRIASTSPARTSLRRRSFLPPRRYGVVLLPRRLPRRLTSHDRG